MTFINILNFKLTLLTNKNISKYHYFFLILQIFIINKVIDIVVQFFNSFLLLHKFPFQYSFN